MSDREQRPTWWTPRPPDWKRRLARIAKRLELTDGEVRALYHLGDAVNAERGYGWLSVAGLGELIGRKRRAVIYIRTHLRDLGIIAYDETDIVPGGGPRTYVRWSFADEGVQQAAPLEPPGPSGVQPGDEGVQRAARRVQPQADEGAQVVAPNPRMTLHDDLSRDPPHVGAPERAPVCEPPEALKRAQDPDRNGVLRAPTFEDFWNEYPRKLGKKTARKAWQRLRPDAELAARVVAAVTRLRETRDWLREGGRGIPSPTRFLEEERWEDANEVPLEPAYPPYPTAGQAAEITEIMHADVRNANGSGRPRPAQCAALSREEEEERRRFLRQQARDYARQVGRPWR